MQENNLSIKLKIYRKICFWGMKILPDKLYLTMIYQVRNGKKINWKSPKSFNEKLNWLKLYDRRPEYMKMVDKYEVREYIKHKLGEKYLVPILGVWEKVEEIDFKKLPECFVLKCSHDSGSVIICKDKKKLNESEVKKRLQKFLDVNYFYLGREWPYKYIKPHIIAEVYMEDENKKDLPDYKLMCFNGKVKCIFVCSNRQSEKGLNVTFFDLDWKRLPFERKYPSDPNVIEKPKTLDEMIILAEKLAENIPFVRIDFYEINSHPYFGEITFYPGSGYEKFEPEEWDEILGSWINIKN